MTNRTRSRWLAPILFALMLMPALARRSHAQTPATYKVGDKIDVLAGSSEIGGKYVGGHWVPGSIVRVTQTTREVMYLVNNDGEQSNADQWRSGLQLRARTGVLSETAIAHNELMALGELKAPHRGSLDEAFQGAIRERYTMRGSKEFPVTVTFQGMLIGKPHKYGKPDVDGESADGPGGSAGTTVYPVTAQYYYRTAYRDAYLTVQQDDVFLCFKNQFREFQCNLGSGKGVIKSFREQRASYP
jgi:hypothetical protein